MSSTKTTSPPSERDASPAIVTKGTSSDLYEEWCNRVQQQPVTSLYSQVITSRLSKEEKWKILAMLHGNIHNANVLLPETFATQQQLVNDAIYAETVSRLTGTSPAETVIDDGENAPLTTTSCSGTAATPAGFLQKLLCTDSSAEENVSETVEPMNGIFVVGESQCYSKKWPVEMFPGIVKMSIQLKTGDLEENYATLNLFVHPGDSLLAAIHQRVADTKEVELTEQKVREWRKRGVNYPKKASTKRFRSN